MLFLGEIEMKFCRNFANMLKNVQIHPKFLKFCYSWKSRLWVKSTTFKLFTVNCRSHALAQD